MSPSPSPAPRRRMPTPYSEMVSPGYNTPLHITPTYHHVTSPPPPQPSLPPLHYSPEPVLTHKADPSPLTYQQYSQPQEVPREEEEPRFILQLVPNPKYKSSQPPAPTTRTTRRPRVDRTAQQQSTQQLRRNDPNLYPYLYLMSSYLPQTHHSLVVAKKS